MDDSYIRKARDIISAVISPDVADQAGQWVGFFSAWGKAAGERLAAHSRPVDIRNGILLVEADHPGWIQLLQMEQEYVLKRLQRDFPKLGIKGMGFRVGRAMRERQDAPNEGRIQALSPGARSEPEKPAPAKADLDAVLASVGDEGFRNLLSSLAKTLTDDGA